MGLTPTIDGVGATILFDDGTKWINKVKIDVDATEKGFEYKAFIRLTLGDLEKLKSKKIKRFRLYIYDQEIKPNEAEDFQIYVNCIKEIK